MRIVIDGAHGSGKSTFLNGKKMKRISHALNKWDKLFFQT